MNGGGAYQKAGVDIGKAENLVSDAAGAIKKATRPEVLAQTGVFGGLFELDMSAYDRPVLVSSIDGVGTKLMVAKWAGQHEQVGYDIVHHCINDVIVQGAEPLFFVDYFGSGNLEKGVYDAVLRGVANACARQNVALLGGETAEMPGMYGEYYDLVGSITGAVEKSAIITGKNVQPGDKLIALPSNGLHTNGYSLARKVLLEDAKIPLDTKLTELNESLGDALLRPHLCYWQAMQRLLEANVELRAAVHITGGGVYGNIPRVLPDGLGVVFDPGELTVPPLFPLIAEKGNVDAQEMYRVFNMGAGMVWIVPSEQADRALECGHSEAGSAVPVGEVVTRKDQCVTVKGVDE